MADHASSRQHLRGGISIPRNIFYSWRVDSKPEDPVRARKPTLTTKECASLLNVGYNTVFELANLGQLPRAKLGKAWDFIEADVMAYLRTERDRKVANQKTTNAPLAYRVGEQMTSRHRPLPRLPDIPVAEKTIYRGEKRNA
jgi:excisionase family DNA binding protein